jgi:hypothetical protein
VVQGPTTTDRHRQKAAPDGRKVGAIALHECSYHSPEAGQARSEKASKAGRASHTPEAEIKRFLRRISGVPLEELAKSARLVSPEQSAQLRALLPGPGDQAAQS